MIFSDQTDFTTVFLVLDGSGALTVPSATDAEVWLDGQLLDMTPTITRVENPFALTFTIRDFLTAFHALDPESLTQADPEDGAHIDVIVYATIGSVDTAQVVVRETWANVDFDSIETAIEDSPKLWGVERPR